MEIFSAGVGGGGRAVDNDDEKILSTCSWPKVFLQYTLSRRETSLLQKENVPILRENKLFIRETVFNSFANYFSWRARKLKSLEPYGALVFR